MAAAIDILLNSDGDLPIETNDLPLGFSDNQHIYDCLISFPGFWKEFPQNGVGVRIFFKARANPQAVIRKASQQLGNDGYTLINPTAAVANDIYQIKPNAVRQ